MQQAKTEDNTDNKSKILIGILMDNWIFYKIILI